MKNNICIVCGKEFLAKRYDRVICSPECKKKFAPNNNPIKDKHTKCEICGKSFVKKRNCQRVCSRECGNKLKHYNSVARKAVQKLTKEKTVYTKKCEHCGLIFETKAKRQIYCSKECCLKHIKDKKEPKVHNNICVWCGKEYVSKRPSRFCCKSCKIKSRSVNVLHHRPYKINNSKQNAVYRNKIGERDNWICNICGGKINKDLKYPDLMSASLDHIVPLSKGGKHTEQNVHISHLHCNIKKQDKLIAP